MKLKINNVLAGLSIGIVVALMPSAVFMELLKLIPNSFHLKDEIQLIVVVTQRLMSICVGVCIARQCHYSMIQAASMTMAIFIGSGAVKLHQNIVILSGTGDIINMFIVGMLCVIVIDTLKDYLKAYTLLVLPTILCVLCGLLGVIILPYIQQISRLIGEYILYATQLQPLLMSILISVSFAFLIVSPISSVAIAMAISINGLAGGSASVGAATCGVVLAVFAIKSNGFSVALAHIIASPKLQLANFVKKPKIFIPVFLMALINGVFSYLFNINVNAIAAGFGVSGLVGPLHVLSNARFSLISIFIVITTYFIVPLIGAVLLSKILVHKKIINDDDFKINY